MPQLDRYLVFSEIFWFVVFFTLVYLVVYVLLISLAKGLRLRSALESHRLSLALHLKTERTTTADLASHLLEARLLELVRSANWSAAARTVCAGYFAPIQEFGLADSDQRTDPLYQDDATAAEKLVLPALVGQLINVTLTSPEDKDTAGVAD